MTPWVRRPPCANTPLCTKSFSVPFLSGLSSGRAGGGSGEGVDKTTVVVINEICERALQSDVAAAIAAAQAIAGVTCSAMN